jgi:hypothetical protein
MDSDDEGDVPPTGVSSSSGGSKKRFEVKKVRFVFIW